MLDRLRGRYLRPVRAMVFPMVLDHSTADDLTQEIFLQALGVLDSYRGEARLSPWLYRLAMNATYSILRARSGRRLEYHAEVPERGCGGTGAEISAILFGFPVLRRCSKSTVMAAIHTMHRRTQKQPSWWWLIKRASAVIRDVIRPDKNALTLPALES